MVNDLTEVAQRNALAECEELSALHPTGFTDEDVLAYIGKNVEMAVAAAYVLEGYTGNNRFMKDLKARQSGTTKVLSHRQIRAILNIHTGKDKQKHAGTGGTTRTGDACTPPSEREYECFVCHRKVIGLDNIREHGRLHKSGVLDAEGNEVQEAPVLEVTTSLLNLDLSNLPNGRFAAPNLTGSNDMIFLMVTRVRKDKIRDRRYRFGMYRTGRERVPAGTIEVKEWSSDQKRLCGQQKPGEVYQGEFEEQIEWILGNPETYAKLFGLLIGACGICGKTLTDEVSRAYGIGPECQKKNDYWSTRPKSYIGEDK